MTMPPTPDRGTFESIYAGKAPWDIGKPQEPFIEIATLLKVITPIDIVFILYRSAIGGAAR